MKKVLEIMKQSNTVLENLNMLREALERLNKLTNVEHVSPYWTAIGLLGLLITYWTYCPLLVGSAPAGLCFPPQAKTKPARPRPRT